jgi:hypothetical protein
MPKKYRKSGTGIISMCTPADLHLVCEACGQEHPCPCDLDFYDGSMREFRWLYNIADDVPDADLWGQYSAWLGDIDS